MVFAIAGIVITSTLTTYFYFKSSNNLDSVKDERHIEVIRITAEDGTPLKAIFMIDKNQYTETNHSTPLIVACHGMVKDYLHLRDLAETLLQHGYAVLLPESRGHGSNPAPSTLATLETSDIIQFMDYMEDNFDCLNISNSGIYGQSMGALYATMTYILESLGENRFRALVETAGPVNLSREIDFVTNNPGALGQISLLENVEEKNPILWANETFPTNVLIVHDEDDPIVSFQCGQDFYEKIDPTGERLDVEFYNLQGNGHSIYKLDFTVQHTIAWFDKYIKQIETEPESIEIYESPIDILSANRTQTCLLLIFIFLAVLLPSITYLVGRKYELFTYDPEITWMKKIFPEIREINPNLIEQAGKGHRKRIKFVWLSLYALAWFINGALALLFKNYFVNEIALGGLGTLTIIIAYMFYYRKDPEMVELNQYIVRKSLNLKYGLYWMISISLSMFLYFSISSSQIIENTILVPGARNNWWIPLSSLYLTFQLVCNIIFIRLIFPRVLKNPKFRLRESILNGLLYGGGMGLFFVLTKQASIYIGNLNLPLYIVFAGTFGLIFVIYDIITQLTEGVTQSILPASFALAWVVAMGIGASNVIFIN